MPELIQMIITVVCAVLASSGIWTFLLKKSESKDEKTKLLVGLAHDRILHLCEKYCERGCLTKEEYDDLHKYLFEPYKTLGGNGSAERMIEEVRKLPIKSLAEIAEM